MTLLGRSGSAPRWPFAVGGAVLFAAAGTLGLSGSIGGAVGDMPRLEGVAAVLSDDSTTVDNYLLVGTDSREGIDPSDPDYASIGSSSDVGGTRTDTMMVVRHDRTDGSLAVMSLPRDLWLRLGDSDRYNRINTARQSGADVLVRTVQRALEIPVHHYVEVDFAGFRSVVDAIGGVEICLEHPARDRRVGLRLRAGCQSLDGLTALRYARSRHLEERIDGSWESDGSSDIGRSRRQRAFLSALASSAARNAAANPMSTGRILGALAGAISVDGDLDGLDLVSTMRELSGSSTRSLSLPVVPGMAGDAAVVRIGERSRPYLDYFAGTGPEPAEE
jgi:LCP family protein required for cell wall assembly